MTEQSQMPLVGPPMRRGWAEIFRFRPLTASTHATLVVTRRGRLASILPAGGPRVLSDYLAWPYDFREVDTRERLLMLDQHVESFDSSYEFLVALRLIYQVVRPDRVALELEDVSTELTLAVVQSLRLSGRSFGVEQDKTFEEHLQETLINSDALAQRVQLLGLVLRRADVIVTLDEPTRAHAEALRYAMRERPLHFQIAVESLEPDRSFDVHVGGAYRLTERRAHDEPGDTIDSAIQTAIARTLQRVGITFEPGDYLSAAKAMAEVLRKDGLLQSELAMVHAQLLRPTVQIQPDRSMVHVPRSSMLPAPDLRPDPMLRRARQGLPRVGRPPALTDTQAPAAEPSPAPALRRALPPPPASDRSASPTLPLEDLPAQGEPIEGAYTLWPAPESLPTMRTLPRPSQPDDESDQRAPWADLIRSSSDQDDVPWLPAPADALSEPIEPLPWDSLAASETEQPAPWQQSSWIASPPVQPSAPLEALPWEHSTIDSAAEHQAFGSYLAPEQAQQEPNPPLKYEQTEPGSEDLLSAQGPETLPAYGPDAQIAFQSAPAAPEEFAGDPADDLGFSLDWSEPEVVQEDVPAPSMALPANNPVDDLGFSLDWSDPQIEPLAQQPASNADTLADTGIYLAHWGDQDLAASEPAVSDPAPAADDTVAAAPLQFQRWPALGFDPLEADPQPAEPASPPAPQEHDPQHDEALVGAEQDVPPWYAPTLHFHDQLPIEPYVETPLEPFGAAWADAQAPGEPSGDLAADAPAESTVEAFDVDPSDALAAQEPNWDIAPETPVETFEASGDAPAPSAYAYDQAPDVPVAAPSETVGTGWDGAQAPSEPVLDAAEAPQEATTAAWDDVPEPGELAYAMATDAAAEPLGQAPSAEPAIETASAPAAASEQISPNTQPAAEIPADLLARMLGMIQSYGPAWFKMWSLELKERPERLPVVLGEVTADPVLLAQADDPRVQAALLAAVEAYTSPPVHPTRLPTTASLPSPVMASQSSSDQDEVPDWLSLRTKWNGHGGGA